MKNIQWNSIKSENFNLTSIIEESVEINPNDLFQTSEKLEILNEELMLVREAIIFKKSRLEKNIDNTESDEQFKLIQRMQEKMRHIQLDPLGDSLEILEKNRQIVEFKTIQKIFRYSIELEKDERQVLELLLQSELLEDLKFLSTLISCFLMSLKSFEKTEIFLEYSKKVEGKIANYFTDFLKIDGYIKCKECVSILEILVKEKILYDAFLYEKAPFNKPVSVQPLKLKKIPLEGIKTHGNSFQKFIREIQSLIELHLDTAVYIFDATKSFNDYFLDQLFNFIISKALYCYFNVTDSYLWLLTLEDAHFSIHLIANLITNNFRNFKVDGYIINLFSQYFSLAIHKEKEVIDDIFDTMIHGDNGKLTKYSLFGNVLKKEDDEVLIFTNILLYFYTVRSRANKIYTKAQETEIVSYFLKNVLKLMGRIQISSSDGYEAVEKITKIFLISKKFFNEELHYYEDFVESIENLIRSIFKNILAECRSVMRFKIEKLYFLDQNCMQDVMDYIKYCIQKGEIFQGQNFNIYADKILYELFFLFCNQMKTIVFTREQSKHLMEAIDRILGYAVFMNRTQLFQYYEYLKNLGLLITTPKEDFMKLYEQWDFQIPEDDLRVFLKCRKDKSEIKNLIAGSKKKSTKFQ